MIQSTEVRRFARNVTAILAVIAGAMLVVDLAATVSVPLSQLAVHAAPAGTPPVGPISISPATGPLTNVQVTPTPAPALCPGDSASDGYRVQTFIVTAGTDPATLTYDSNGPVLPAGGAGVAFPLVSATGINQVNRTTAVNTGQIVTTPPINLGVYGSSLLPDGAYSIGYACSLSGQTEAFWASEITVTGSSFATTTTTTTTTTVADTTTTTTVAGETTTTTTTTTTVAGGTTTTTVAGGSTNATVTPSSPTAGGAYSVAFPSCTVGETITFSQPESSPGSVVDVCEASSALTAGSVAGVRMPSQVTTGTATGSFTAAPTAPGTYTITMTGTTSAQRTTTFVIIGASTPIGGGSNANANANTGGSPTNSNTGTIPSTGSSTTSLIVWGLLLLVFGRMAILLGRKPKVLTGT
jgi:hypothetical protein